MDIVFHIGYYRTGTTFLQTEIFPKLSDMNYIDNNSIKKLIELLHSPSKDIDVKQTRSDWINSFSKNETNLISNEILSGNPFDQKNLNDGFIAADKIHALFPNARIIVGIREKSSMIISLYKQYLQEGGIDDFKVFEDKIKNKVSLDSDRYIDYLKNLFSHGNVYVYTYEKLRKNSHDFVKGICDFIGAKTPDFKNKQLNVGYGKKQVEVALILNRFIKSEYNPEGIIPQKIIRFFSFPKQPSRLLLQNSFSYKLTHEKYNGEQLKVNGILKKIAVAIPCFFFIGLADAYYHIRFFLKRC